MTRKNAALTVIQQLPSDATFDEIIEEVSILADIELAQKDIDEGRVMSHEEFAKEVLTWSVDIRDQKRNPE